MRDKLFFSRYDSDFLNFWDRMVNFRKLKADLSPTLLKEGQSLHKKGVVNTVKITSFETDKFRLNCSVLGNYENAYACEIEIDRKNSSVIDSDCDCPHKYDCQHLAAVLFYLEDHLDELVVSFSKESDPTLIEGLEEEVKEELLETFKEAETKEVVKKGKKYEKELVQEYTTAAHVLSCSPFFVPEDATIVDKAELIVLFNTPPAGGLVEVRLALRLPFRSKPLNVYNLKDFLNAIRYQEPLYIGSRRFSFSQNSFSPESAQILKRIMDFGHFSSSKEERFVSIILLDVEAFGTILAHAYDLLQASGPAVFSARAIDKELTELPIFCVGSLEEPLRISAVAAEFQFDLTYFETHAPKLLLHPTITVSQDLAVTLDQVMLFECAKPGLLYNHVYYRFQPHIKRKHLRDLSFIRDLTIPEPLFGTFIENALPELKKLASITHTEVIERCVTLPFVGEVKAICDLQYLDGELEATVHFVYDDIIVPASDAQVTAANVLPFVKKEGILARNLNAETKIIEDLFQDFEFDPKTGSFGSKNEKKIVEFMTDVVPRNQEKVTFNCPKNLLDKFIYDDTRFTLQLRETDRVDLYKAELKVSGGLLGFTIDQLWDCIATKRSFIELKAKKGKKKECESGVSKILVLDLEKLSPIIQLFDEMGLTMLDNHVEERPLWSLASINAAQFEGLPVEFKMTERLEQIQKQMLGEVKFKAAAIPTEIKTDLREYQLEGIQWLERLRSMHLSGILADDMGLGKTVQAIVALSQYRTRKTGLPSLVVSPTSLVYNWKEELTKFNPKLKVQVIDGPPPQRKKLLASAKDFDLLITSYSLLQKDIDCYAEHNFGYAILDEAQHIKNRGTRNAKSVKMLRAEHRLILTGTPIENSLEELWSLFDFLMPGLLSTFERFAEKYIRGATVRGVSPLAKLRQKVSPFILRRMKKDVLQELPPVSHIVYHCHMSDLQKDLYQAYAKSAREELEQLVKKEGFNKVQIQILATLTRLKQICCHPAIFAKDHAESGDSAKYEMLLELLGNLLEGGHKTVIFSQYTRMLQIIKKDLERMGVRFCYLDGASKDRMAIVKQFNEDENVLVFLVSLKAGGTGLNLVSADSVIHYDPWWNPAAEDQATDRVHRIGQKQNVSSYKLVTLSSIEEKILEMQNRKRGLVKKVISSDEEAISKLTWEEVLELLKT